MLFLSGFATIVFVMSAMYFHVFAPTRGFSRFWEIVFLGLSAASLLFFEWLLHLKP